MGLCKCPKKKVTNLFCFEHRVNVCEHCLVENHGKCVVQSYLSWLADSDYDKNCSLCSTPFESKETVRLKCLHLFHWECLDTWARSLPAKTAPAGYKCRICQEVIFPAPNQTSPAIEQLRMQLQLANWARAGLGLALLPETHENGAPIPVVSNSTQIPYDSWNSQSVQYTTNDTSGNARASPATAVDIGDDFVQQTQFLARKPVGISESVPLLQQTKRDVDLPENKYKRRSASEWFTRWFQSRYVNRSAYAERSNCKRGLCKLLLVLFILATVCTIMLRMIGRPRDDDPAFDPLANPNILVALQQEFD